MEDSSSSWNSSLFSASEHTVGAYILRKVTGPKEVEESKRENAGCATGWRFNSRQQRASHCKDHANAVLAHLVPFPAKGTCSLVP